MLALEMPVGSSALTAEAEVGAFHCLQQFVGFTEVKSTVSNCLTGFFFFFLFLQRFLFLNEDMALTTETKITGGRTYFPLCFFQ